jgi:hypothetical protein
VQEARVEKSVSPPTTPTTPPTAIKTTAIHNPLCSQY